MALFELLIYQVRQTELIPPKEAGNRFNAIHFTDARTLRRSFEDGAVPLLGEEAERRRPFAPLRAALRDCLERRCSCALATEIMCVFFVDGEK